MKPSEKKQLLVLGLETYVKWLNSAPKLSDDQPEYTVDQFIVNNPKQDLFGRYKILSLTLGSGNADAVLHAVVTDGDEGGPTDLIIGFSRINPDKKTVVKNLAVEFIMQGFDTSWGLIFNEGDQFLYS